MRTIPLEDIPSWTDFPASQIKHSRRHRYPFNPVINSCISFLPRADSTRLEIDAIVNAANSDLAAGGGICGAIFSAAGGRLDAACDELGGCDTGKAVVTPGFDLPAKYIIHAVGPIGEDPQALEGAYQSTLDLMDGEKIRSVGMCCLSTGIYGYPVVPATHIALKTVRNFLEVEENRSKIDRIIFVVFMADDVKVYHKLLPQYFPLREALSGDADEEEEEDEDTSPRDQIIPQKVRDSDDIADLIPDPQLRPVRPNRVIKPIDPVNFAHLEAAWRIIRAIREKVSAEEWGTCEAWQVVVSKVHEIGAKYAKGEVTEESEAEWKAEAFRALGIESVD
jgi:O-acetyl-ADP-ribose deacetylase (regulator of RNase III)